ncbi:MAG: hypothetical protein ABW101_14180 [Candidatus Thiodiazotropha sp.]
MTQNQTHPEADPSAQLDQLRQQIAEVVAQRDALKQAIEAQQVPASQGLRTLVELDERLSQLDSAFKQGWDAQQ